MAHSVEGRYPFLDHRVVELCSRLPAEQKLRGLRDKWLLRQLGRTMLPADIWQRRKRPYRAPIQRSFFAGGREVEYVEALLAPEAIRRGGCFKPDAVQRLARKARSTAALSEVEAMALVGILSTQLIDHLYVRRAWQPAPIDSSVNFKLVDRSPVAA
jgi:asparagine synthase (glutamine-hydrolysing)